MPQTKEEKVQRRRVSRFLKRAATIDNLSDYLLHFCREEKVLTTHDLKILFGQAVHVIECNPDSGLVNSTGKRQKTLIVNNKVRNELTGTIDRKVSSTKLKVWLGYDQVSRNMWEILANKVKCQVCDQNHGKQGCFRAKTKATVRISRPKLSIKHSTHKLWKECGGDNRTTILSSHVVLCNAGNFPTAENNECSHLCHDRGCINPLHLRWEPRMINRNRNHCKTQGFCSGHEGFDDCML